MKKLLFLIGIFVCVFPITAKAAVASSVGTRDLNIYLFRESECEKCEDIKKYISDKAKKNQNIVLKEIEVKDNKETYNNTKKVLKFKENKYPVIVIGSDYFIGFDSKKLDKVIDSYLNTKGDYCDLISHIENNLGTDNCIKGNSDIYNPITPFKMVIIIICILVILWCIYIMIGLLKEYKQELKKEREKEKPRKEKLEVKEAKNNQKDNIKKNTKENVKKKSKKQS